MALDAVEDEADHQGGNMRLGLIFAAVLSFLHVAPASASVFGDELAKCLVNKTSDADQTALIRWVFTAMAAHPKIIQMSKVTPEQRASYAAEAGSLMERLLTVDCHDQTVAALKADGVGVVERSFEVLGEVAMRGFMGDPAVAATLGGLTKSLDPSRLIQVFREAGLTPNSK